MQAPGIPLPWPSRWPVLLFALMLGTGPVVAQPASSQQPSAPSHSPASSRSVAPPPESAYRAQPQGFQARIDAAARKLAENPRYKNVSPEFLQHLSEFVAGNMLFVLLHEMAHVAITQMGLPVVGRMEDAADTYAALRLIRSGSKFSHRVLTEAAEGWFMADRRDQKTADKVAYYDDHGFNQQRAYQIVCLMVGSDDEKFKDLAKETKLPKERQGSCARDYSNARYSWDLVLKPHRRSPDQPRTSIDVVYGPAEGRAAVAQRVNSSIRLLETVAEHAADEFAWPAPFTLEMQSCGSPNAGWDPKTRKLTVCYELARDFAGLFRRYGDVLAGSARIANSSKRKAIGSAFKPNRQQTRHKGKLSR